MESMSELSHRFVKEALHRQAICIDATLGHGHDAAFFLSQGVRRVIAYEIQPELACKTGQALADSRLEVRTCSHASMERDLQGQAVDAVVFNFGYDPKNPSGIHTRTESSFPAVLAALNLLRPKGRMALVFYSHPEGRKEQIRIRQLLARREDIDCQEVRHPFKPAAPVLYCIEKISRH